MLFNIDNFGVEWSIVLISVGSQGTRTKTTTTTKIIVADSVRRSSAAHFTCVSISLVLSGATRLAIASMNIWVLSVSDLICSCRATRILKCVYVVGVAFFSTTNWPDQFENYYLSLGIHHTNLFIIYIGYIGVCVSNVHREPHITYSCIFFFFSFHSVRRFDSLIPREYYYAIRTFRNKYIKNVYFGLLCSSALT